MQNAQNLGLCGPIGVWLKGQSITPQPVALFLPGCGFAEYVPILLLRLCRFSQISPGSVLKQPLYWSQSNSQRSKKERTIVAHFNES